MNILVADLAIDLLGPRFEPLAAQLLERGTTAGKAMIEASEAGAAAHPLNLAKAAALAAIRFQQAAGSTPSADDLSRYYELEDEAPAEEAPGSQPSTLNSQPAPGE